METEVYKLPRIMEELGQPSLKAIALTFDLNPVRVYSVAKTPKEGEIYDAKMYNWDAIERFVVRRLDADVGLGTLEDVIRRALEVDMELAATDKRKTRGGGVSASRVPTMLIDGKDVPMRRFTNFEADWAPSEGQEYAHPSSTHVILLKRDPGVYKIIHQTLSHTVLRPIGEDGEFNSETPRVMSNSLLNLQGYGPGILTREAVTKKYAEQEESRSILRAQLDATPK